MVTPAAFVVLTGAVVAEAFVVTAGSLLVAPVVRGGRVKPCPEPDPDADGHPRRIFPAAAVIPSEQQP